MTHHRVTGGGTNILTDRGTEQKSHVDNSSCRCESCWRRAERLVFDHLRGQITRHRGEDFTAGLLFQIARDVHPEPLDTQWLELLYAYERLILDSMAHDFQLRHRDAAGRQRVFDPTLPREPVVEGGTDPDEHAMTSQEHKAVRPSRAGTASGAIHADTPTPVSTP